MNEDYHRTKYLFGLILSLGTAVAVRLVMLAVRLVIVPDGIFYLEWAAQVSGGDWGAAFNATVFNLYPVLVAAVHAGLSLFATPSMETAALVLNCVCGVLLVWPLYALAFRYFGLVAACITGVFVAFNPLLALTSAEVLRESPFLALAAWSIYLYITAVADRSPSRWSAWRLALAGALILLAGLVRVEAFGLLGCMGVGLLVVECRRPWGLPARMRAMLALASLVIVCGVLAAVLLRARTGQWHFARLDKLTASWSLGEMDTVADDPLATAKDMVLQPDGSVDTDALYRVNFINMARRYREVLFVWECLDAAFKAFHGLGVLFLAAGLVYLVWRRPLRWSDPLLILTGLMMAILLPVYYRYAATKFYLSSRHVLVLVLPAAVCMGAWWRAIPAYWRVWRLAWLAAAVLGVIIIATETYRPRGRSKVVLRQSGTLLAQELPDDAVVMTSPGMRILRYYAQRRSRDLTPGAEAMVRRYMAKPNRYLVLNLHADWQRRYTNVLVDSIAPAALELPSSSRFAPTLFTHAPVD